MKESVIYQDILEKGRKEGELKGKREGELKVVMMLLNFKFPQLEARLTQKIETLCLSDLEDLAASLLEFQEVNDLEAWLGYPE